MLLKPKINKNLIKNKNKSLNLPNSRNTQDITQKPNTSQKSEGNITTKKIETQNLPLVVKFKLLSLMNSAVTNR